MCSCVQLYGDAAHVSCRGEKEGWCAAVCSMKATLLMSAAGVRRRVGMQLCPAAPRCCSCQLQGGEGGLVSSCVQHEGDAAAYSHSLMGL